MKNLIKAKIGDKFGNWTIIGDAPRINRKRRFTCQCNCGNISILEYGILKRISTHCNKCRKGKSKILNRNNPQFSTKDQKYKYTYHSYRDMLRRCYDIKNNQYKNYGKRGIIVCERWRENFSNFVEDMGLIPKGFSIERKNVNKNYEPKNCIWIDKRLQGRNTTRTKWIEFNGERKSMVEWSESTGINYSTINQRLRKGWSIQRTLTTPTQKVGLHCSLRDPI